MKNNRRLNNVSSDSVCLSWLINIESFFIEWNEYFHWHNGGESLENWLYALGKMNDRKITKPSFQLRKLEKKFKTKRNINNNWSWNWKEETASLMSPKTWFALLICLHLTSGPYCWCYVCLHLTSGLHGWWMLCLYVTSGISAIPS